jgi:hypothetical protein
MYVLSVPHAASFAVNLLASDSLHDNKYTHACETLKKRNSSTADCRLYGWLANMFPRISETPDNPKKWNKNIQMQQIRKFI